MIKRVDRYVGSTVVRGILMAWVGLVTLFLVLSFVGELRDARGNYGPLEAIWYSLLTLPRVAYLVFPVAALVGALLGAGGLAAGFELVAFRAAGVSRLRLSLAAIGGGLLMLIPALWMGEFLAPDAEQHARTFRLLHQDGGINLGGKGGLWIREGDSIVNIKNPIITSDDPAEGVRFEGVTLYRIGEQQSLDEIWRAGSATPGTDGWTLEQLTSLRIGERLVERQQQERRHWDTQVDPGLLDSAVTRPQYLSMRDLGTYMSYLDANGQDARAYRSAWWEKLFYPFTALALILAGMPFVFGSARQHSVGFRMFIGIALGAVYLLFNRSVTRFGEAYGMHEAMAGAIPVLLLAAVGIWALRRTP